MGYRQQLFCYKLASQLFTQSSLEYLTAFPQETVEVKPPNNYVSGKVKVEHFVYQNMQDGGLGVVPVPRRPKGMELSSSQEYCRNKEHALSIPTLN
jgi:hypothetical protein